MTKRWTKRCTRCRVIKDAEWDFYHSIRHYASGSTGDRVDSVCKECRKAQSAAYRGRLRRAGTLPAKLRQWHANMDQEKRRATERDYARMRAMLRGEVKNPRGSYIDRRQEREIRVPKGPLVEYLIEKGSPDARRLHRMTGYSEDVFRLRHKRVELGVVDAVCTAFGEPDQVAVMYPFVKAPRRAA